MLDHSVLVLFVEVRATAWPHHRTTPQDMANNERAKTERQSLLNLFENDFSALDACANVIESDLSLDPLTLARP